MATERPAFFITGDPEADALLGRDEWGPSWALGGLALGAAASTAAVALGKRGADSSSGEGPVADAARDEEIAGDPATAES